jgi:nucleoside 2-deoxyribosyltransferase|tara:strand:+ start:54 stop:431 length:378 start_codon:yes stop_codon:yes gene_type:complete
MGEDPKELKKIIPQIHEAIKEAGHEYYSTIFDSEQFINEKWSGKQIMKKAFRKIDNSDLILFFVRSSEISQGMLVELGYSLAKKKKIMLAIQKSIYDSIFRRHIDKVIEFEDLKDLKQKLSRLNI